MITTYILLSIVSALVCDRSEATIRTLDLTNVPESVVYLGDVLHLRCPCPFRGRIHIMEIRNHSRLFNTTDLILPPLNNTDTIMGRCVCVLPRRRHSLLVWKSIKVVAEPLIASVSDNIMQDNQTIMAYCSCGSCKNKTFYTSVIYVTDGEIDVIFKRYTNFTTLNSSTIELALTEKPPSHMIVGCYSLESKLLGGKLESNILSVSPTTGRMTPNGLVSLRSGSNLTITCTNEDFFPQTLTAETLSIRTENDLPLTSNVVNNVTINAVLVNVNTETSGVYKCVGNNDHYLDVLKIVVH